MFHISRMIELVLGLTLVAAFYLGGVATIGPFSQRPLAYTGAFCRPASAGDPPADRPDDGVMVALRGNIGPGTMVSGHRLARSMGMKFASMLTDVLKSLVTPVATKQYPVERLEAPLQLRGRLNWDPTECIGCGLCVKDCPAECAGTDHHRQKRKTVCDSLSCRPLHFLQPMRFQLPERMSGFKS
jgi:NAD-dependent dihydropyrimidine dehydrogenase PreA subunit